MSTRHPNGPAKPVAPHVQAAVGAVQARLPVAAPKGRPPAAHVQAAVAAVQAKVAPRTAGGPPVPPAPGARAVQARPPVPRPAVPPPPPRAVAQAAPRSVPPPRMEKPAIRHEARQVVQARVGFEYELGDIKTEKRTRIHPLTWGRHSRGEVIKKKAGYDVTADSGPNNTSQLEFIISDVDENNPADCARAVLAARSVQADIQDLAQPQNVGNWVRGDQARIGSSSSHRFVAEVSLNQLVGQLQATAGLDVGRLPEVVSGRAVNQPSMAQNRAQPFLGNYHGQNYQPIWHAARAEVRRFPLLDNHQQEVLASVVTMIAQVPLALYGETPGGQGMFTAKTDFSKIVTEALDHIQYTVKRHSFEAIVMNTINTVIGQGLNPQNVLTPTDGVFPPGYQAAGVPLGGLTIRQWLSNMLPNRAGQQGRDLMTPQHFPGTKRQRKEMRAFGRMGNQVDPGNRPIFEFRNLTTVYPDQLPDAVAGVLEYVRSANTPPAAPRRLGWKSLLAASLFIGGTIGGYYYYYSGGSQPSQ